MNYNLSGQNVGVGSLYALTAQFPGTICGLYQRDQYTFEVITLTGEGPHNPVTKQVYLAKVGDYITGIPHGKVAIPIFVCKAEFGSPVVLFEIVDPTRQVVCGECHTRTLDKISAIGSSGDSPDQMSAQEFGP